MSAVDPWVGIAAILIGVIGGLLRHVAADARYRQRLRNLENRVKKFDGIDTNGE